MRNLVDELVIPTIEEHHLPYNRAERDGHDVVVILLPTLYRAVPVFVMVSDDLLHLRVPEVLPAGAATRDNTALDQYLLKHNYDRGPVKFARDLDGEVALTLDLFPAELGLEPRHLVAALGSLQQLLDTRFPRLVHLLAQGQEHPAGLLRTAVEEQVARLLEQLSDQAEG